MRKSLLTAAIVALFSTTCLHADELRLKDGTRIVGSIVGFEDNSFKVQTSYGYAIVRKDHVATILVSDAEKVSAREKKHETLPARLAEAPPPNPAKAPEPSAAKPARNEAPDHPAATEAAPTAPGRNRESIAKAFEKEEKPAPPKPVKKEAPKAPAVAAAAPVPAAPQPAPKPEAPPMPEPVKEVVAGNTYENLTYGFRLYKPPGWQVIEGAPNILPGAVAAMGTGDERTYLLVGEESLKGSLEAHAAATEKRLRELMGNYRPLGRRRVTISGAAGLEQRFRGMVDEHDWSGTVAFIPHGNQIFTIYGMTSADSDLVQIQENVIARTIASLEFLPAKSDARR